MSPREFDGWTPIEVHQHYDADNNLTGTTVVTRESPWDDESRARALQLHRFEANLCSCGCGQPAQEAYNPDAIYKVHAAVCMAGRAKKQQERADREEAKQKKKSEGWDDGRFYYVEHMDPGEVSRG